MKIFYVSFFFCFSFLISSAQAPVMRTQKMVSDIGASYEPEMFGAGLSSGIIPKVHMLTSGGNTIAAGNSFYGYPSAFIGELNKRDSILWAKYYNRINYNAPANYDAQLRSLQPAIDSGYITMGNFRQTDGAWVMQLGNKGDSVWQRVYGGSGYDEGSYICRVQNNGYIFIGTSDSYDGTLASARTADTNNTRGRVWICRIDKTGTPLWSRCFGYPYGGGDKGVIIKTTRDGGFICGADMQSINYGGGSYHGGHDIWLAKLDSAGIIQWAKYYGGSSTDLLGDIEETVDGGFLFVGSTLSRDGDVSGFHGVNGQTDAWVVKITSTGKITWQKCIGGSAADYLVDAISTQDGGYAAIGATSSRDGNVNTTLDSSNVMLVKLSAGGELSWVRTFGSNDFDFGRNVMQTGENDYLISWITRGAMYNSPSNGNWIAHLGGSSTINGTAYYDENDNGKKDANERWVDNTLVTVTKQNSYQRSALIKNGLFAIEVDTGSYSAHLDVNLPYYNVVPASTKSTFTSYFQTDSIGFRLVPIPGKQDLAISLFPLTTARPGFTSSYLLTYRNVGTTTISSGSVVLKKDSRTSLLFANPATDSISDDSFAWNYTDLKPGDTASVFVDLQIAVPPTVNNGDTLSYSAMINPVSIDETPANDTARLKQVAIGSYDPNDKSESNAGFIPLSFVTNGNYLQYTIRFQNTGTDTAFNIVVRDTLSNRLDWNSLEMVAASHPYTLSINNGGQLAWRFNNILLPDSNRNEPASHGYIVYRIKPKTDLAKGEIVHNTASIYFDFNLPVVTNDATTQVQTNLAVLPQGLLHFYGSRQEQQVKLFWQVAEGAGLSRFEIERSEDGRNFHPIHTRFAAASESSYAFTDAQVSQATVYYRLKLIQASGSFTYSHVLLFQGRTNAGPALTIYPNPLTTQGYVALYSADEKKAELQLLNAAGLLISRETVTLTQGRNVFALSKTPQMLPGQYTMRVISQGQVIAQTLIVR